MTETTAINYLWGYLTGALQDNCVIVVGYTLSATLTAQEALDRIKIMHVIITSIAMLKLKECATRNYFI